MTGDIRKAPREELAPVLGEDAVLGEDRVLGAQRAAPGKTGAKPATKGKGQKDDAAMDLPLEENQFNSQPG